MSWRAAFTAQANSCRALGSPFTAMLLDGFARFGLPEGPVGERIARWPGDISSKAASVPLRLAGALHGLVLEGHDAALARLYPPHAMPEQQVLWHEACAAITRHAEWVDQRLNSAPQTNEVARASALILAADWLGRQLNLPIMLSELGASAGLNLNFDQYQLFTPEGGFGPADSPVTLRPAWRSPAPTPQGFSIAERRGVDLNPQDPIKDRMRLLSFIWPDQDTRFARIAAALDIAATHPTAVDRGDAIDWLAARLSASHPGQLHLVYHTVAWQYFPPEAQRRGEALLHAAGGTRDQRRSVGPAGDGGG